VLADGWTLSYEMLFYVLFAFALWLRAPVLRVLAPTLGFLALLSFVRADDWPAIAALADTLVLEFLLGVCIGMAVLRGFKLPLPTALAIMTAAFAIILSIGTGPVIGAARLVEPQSLRVLAWGLPAAAIVLAAASSEQALGRLLPRWSLDLGEASYSIYLTHSFVLPVIGMAIVRLSVSTHVAPVLAVVLGVLCSSAAGVATYRLVERPLLGALRKVTRRTAAAA
jgi:exopolysaccharide production protein ExoZ